MTANEGLLEGPRRLRQEVTNPDIMNEEASQSHKKEAPPGPYKKAADDYVEYYATPRRDRGTDINGEVYLVPVSKQYRQNYDLIRWDK